MRISAFHNFKILCLAEDSSSAWTKHRALTGFDFEAFYAGKKNLSRPKLFFRKISRLALDFSLAGLIVHFAQPRHEVESGFGLQKPTNCVCRKLRHVLSPNFCQIFLLVICDPRVTFSQNSENCHSSSSAWQEFLSFRRRPRLRRLKLGDKLWQLEFLKVEVQCSIFRYNSLVMSNAENENGMHDLHGRDIGWRNWALSIQMHFECMKMN